MLLLLAALACSPPAPPPEATLAAAPVPAPDDRADPCVEACERARMMEARAAEAIHADCVRACAEAPVIRDGSGARAALGRPVRVTGRVERVGLPTGNPDVTGTALVLDDGATVWVSYGEPPPGWTVGQRVVVPGTLTDGAPPGPPPGGSAVIVTGLHLAPSGAPTEAP